MNESTLSIRSADEAHRGRGAVCGHRRRPFPGLILSCIIAVAPAAAGLEQRGGRGAETVPTLGLEQGIVQLDAPRFELELVAASQTVAALRPEGGGGFDFTPADWLERRNGDGFFHLGDLTLRLRSGTTGAWQEYSTAAARQPVEALAVSAPVLAAADLVPSLPADIPLRVHRYWEVVDGQLALRFELHNRSGQPVQIGVAVTIRPDDRQRRGRETPAHGLIGHR